MGAKFVFNFDGKAVIADQEKKATRALFRTGGYSRVTMRGLFRTSKKISAPGDPPRIRYSGSPLKQLVEFDVDTQSLSVITGPRYFKPVYTQNNTSIPTPRLLDQGGTVRTRRNKVARYRPRPYVQRTFDLAAKKLSDFMSSEGRK